MVVALRHREYQTKKIFTLILIISTCFIFVSCLEIEERVTRYGSGSIRTTTQFITGPNSEVILHGAQMTWFPNGKKEATNIYVHGIQQGYAYRWYPNGKLKSVVHYTNGIRDQKEKVWQLSETALIKN